VKIHETLILRFSLSIFNLHFLLLLTTPHSIE